jgi:hypothetical protein
MGAFTRLEHGLTPIDAHRRRCDAVSTFPRRKGPAMSTHKTNVLEPTEGSVPAHDDRNAEQPLGTLEALLVDDDRAAGHSCGRCCAGGRAFASAQGPSAPPKPLRRSGGSGRMFVWSRPRSVGGRGFAFVMPSSGYPSRHACSFTPPS